MKPKHDEYGGVWKVCSGVRVDSQRIIRDIYGKYTSLGSVPAIMVQLGTMNRFRRQVGDASGALYRCMEK